jgi:3-deoxy-D-manno-octulosonic-acid transferase
MRLLLDFLYGCALELLFPWLLFKACTTGRYRRGLTTKLFGLAKTPEELLRDPRPRVWFHGVSVGEIHLLRQVVAAFRQRHPEYACVISTTTDTGFDEARQRFPDLAVVYYPFDFSWAVRRTLRVIDPMLIVLAEGELWPNFLIAARQRGVPVVSINGRMSPRSYRNYRRLGGLARWLLGHLDLCAVQTQEYADNLLALGVAPQTIHVTGSVKYDGVSASRANPKTQELRQLFDVRAEDLIWIAGSTQTPEEEIVLDIFRRLQPAQPNLRLFIVPRQKDRFEEVARLLENSGLPFARRSALRAPRSALILVDTIGELGALWGLADVAFVGGSMDGKRGGQNMIEPAAYGAAVVFGPHVWNFKQPAAKLVAIGGAVQINNAMELEVALRRLLDSQEERQQRGTIAQRFVYQQQGATARTITLLEDLLRRRASHSSAA